MPVSLHASIKILDEVLLTEVADEAVLLDLRTETYYGLNESGSRILAALLSNVSVGDAIRELTGEYPVDVELLQTDVLNLIDDLARTELVQING